MLFLLQRSPKYQRTREYRFKILPNAKAPKNCVASANNIFEFPICPRHLRAFYWSNDVTFCLDLQNIAQVSWAQYHSLRACSKTKGPLSSPTCQEEIHLPGSAKRTSWFLTAVGVNPRNKTTPRYQSRKSSGLRLWKRNESHEIHYIKLHHPQGVRRLKGFDPNGRPSAP